MGSNLSCQDSWIAARVVKVAAPPPPQSCSSTSLALQPLCLASPTLICPVLSVPQQEITVATDYTHEGDEALIAMR